MFPILRRCRLLVLAACLLAATGLARASNAQILLVFGDSLSSGYHMDSEQSWPALLQQRLQESGQSIRVVNASRKGETTEGGLKRLQAALDSNQPNWVVLELGANDGLKMQPLDEMKKNLAEMVAMIRAAGATPILVSMELPPSYERRYASGFSSAFFDTARETGSPLVPFLLRKVVDQPELFFPDHLHPTAEAQSKLLDVVWPVVAPLLPRP